MTADSLVDAARERVLAEHGPLLDAVDECADATAAALPADADGESVRDALRACLDRRDALSALASALADAVDATGREPSARPVAAPPYVVVASTGPVLRATLPDGRLVVRFEVFRVTDDARYARGAAGADALRVELL